jgi:hypothetical protein
MALAEVDGRRGDHDLRRLRRRGHRAARSAAAIAATRAAGASPASRTITPPISISTGASPPPTSARAP